MSLASGYVLARDQALRTITALANARHRQQNEHTEKQITRMSRYYSDLLAELDDQASRASALKKAGDDTAKFASRRDALHREEKVRVAELRQKSSLRVQVRLQNVLVIEQPKLLIHAALQAEKRDSEHLELIWDPLTEALEAISCPQCQRPMFALALNRLNKVACPNCVATLPSKLLRR